MNNANQPLLSVVICTRNRADVLLECLQSLDQQNCIYPFEIVVVDNASEDNTREVVEDFKANATVRVNYVLEARLGLSYARNTGVEEAAGGYIAFVDDDVIVTPQWAQAIVDGHKEFQADCVAGKILPKLMAPEPAWLPKWKKTTGQMPVVWGYCDFGDAPLPLSDPGYVLPGNNMSFDKRVFEKIGLFDVNLGRKGSKLYSHEDQDISRRAHEAGYKFYYIPEAFLWHKVPADRMTGRYLIRLAWDTGVSEPVNRGWAYRSLVHAVFIALIEWIKSPQLYYFKNLVSRLGHLWGKLTWKEIG